MASDLRGDASSELALLIASALVRRFNAAAAAGTDQLDTDTLPLLASMRAVSTSFRHGASAAMAQLHRVRLPSDGALVMHAARLLPALQHLLLSRAWRNVPPAPPPAGAWPALRLLCVNDCRWVDAAWLAAVAPAAPNVVALHAARCTLDVLATYDGDGAVPEAQDAAVSAAGAALVPWAPNLQHLVLSGAVVSMTSLANLLRACRRLTLLDLSSVCRVHRRAERQPDGRMATCFTDVTKAWFNALRARAHRLHHLDLSFTPALRLVPLHSVLKHLNPDARLVLDCCHLPETTLQKLRDALPGFDEFVPHECPDEAILMRADAVRQHRRLRKGSSSQFVSRAVRCDWEVFQQVLRFKVAAPMACSDLMGIALLGTERGFAAQLDGVGVGAGFDFTETADLCMQPLCRDAGGAWRCAAPLRHVPIPFERTDWEDGPDEMGPFRETTIEAALRDAIHDCFFSTGVFERMRLFRLAVPWCFERDEFYELDIDDESDDDRLPPLCRQPRTEAQEAQRSAELLEWATAAYEARFVHPERFDPAPPHPPGFANPHLMAVVDPPCRHDDGTGCAWSADIGDGSWFLHKPYSSRARKA